MLATIKRTLLAIAALVVSAPSLFGGTRYIANNPSTNAVESVNWTAGVSYSYDGSGNIKQIGNDRFAYDQVGRLVRAEVNGVVRTYQYDAFGNRIACTHAPGKPEQSDCQYDFDIDPQTNRVQGVPYDDAGNVERFAGHTYLYDSENMVASDTNAAGQSREYIYTADDERIATYHVGSSWNWTIRDATGKVLREFTSDDSGPAGKGSGSWRWTQDYVYREGLLLASRHESNDTAVTFHYHLDHLGTPRRVTDQNDLTVGFHDYFPFGPEVAGGLDEEQATSLRYTGHERDVWGVQGLDTLDYMHARYYNPALGRFLSLDPGEDWDTSSPQSWNGYAYVRNSPINNADPTGQWLDTVVDVVDLGVGIVDMWKSALDGRPVTLQQNLAVGASIVGIITPGATGLGTAVRHSDDVIDGAKRTQQLIESANDARKNITKNSDRVGMDFTKAGKKKIDEENAAKYGGKNVCEECKVEVVPAKKSKKGERPPDNERHRDHKKAKSKGGKGTPDNGQILCRKCNLDKSNKDPGGSKGKNKERKKPKPKKKPAGACIEGQDACR